MLRTGTIAAFAVVCGLLSVAAAQAAGIPIKLFLSQDGAALSDFPSRHTLSKTIKVERTQGKGAAHWAATADQAWLTVTPSGKVGGKLTIKANVTGLTKDQLYSANVTVSTTDGDFTDSETLRVGLWAGSADPAPVFLPKKAFHIAMNPVSPIAYVADDGVSIDRYNVYTGELLGSFKRVAPKVGYMEVSSDGSMLFAADETNFKIVALNAQTGAVLGTYPLGYRNDMFFNIVYVRAYGQPAIYVSGYLPFAAKQQHKRGSQSLFYGGLIAVPSGEKLADGVVWGPLAATPDGKKVVAIPYGGETADIWAYDLVLKKGALSLKKTGSVGTEGENCPDVVLSRDGKFAFTACGWPYRFDVYDTKTLELIAALPASPYPDNIEIDSAERIVGGIIGLLDTPFDVFVYDKKGKAVGQVPTYKELGQGHGQEAAAMKISGDGTRVVSVTEAVYGPQTLMFRNMP